MSLLRGRFLNPLEQFEHCQAKSIRYDLHGIQGWIGVPILDPAQVGLVEAAPFPELDLTLLPIGSQVTSRSRN